MVATMKNIIKRYGDRVVLDHLNIEVRNGEILGLLGPNGAGKTTTIRTMAGLVNADSGEVTIFGQKQSVKNLEIRRNMGIVTQEITVFTDLTVMENLRYFGGLYGLRGAELKANIQEVLKFIGLEDRANQRPGKLSGGMQRRLNIGCALVHKPKLVIMDEPTVGIDPQSRNHILESVKKLAENGTTVIYTSHYMEEVQAICDRIVIMDSGRVILSGTLEELVGQVQHEEQLRFTSIMPSQALTDSLKAISGVKSVEKIGKEYVVVSGAGSGNVNRIMEIAGRHGGVSSFSEEKLNLEDVFLTLTGKKLRDGEE